MIQDMDHRKRWTRFGTIVQRTGRKYTIRVRGSGRIITRNRRYLKEATPTSSSPDVYTELPDVRGPVTEHHVVVDPGVSDSPAPQEGDIGSSRETSTPVCSAHSGATKIPLMLKRLLPYNNEGLNE